jgi:beta-mannosidase
MASAFGGLVSLPAVELTDGWRAAEADEDLRRTYYEEAFDDGGWEPMTVPSHWRSLAAFAESDGPLLHRCHFEHPVPESGRRAWLTFEGLFYQGDHWLDGGYLGDTEGYFMPHTFEVTEALRQRTEHVLASEVACAPQADKTAKRNITGVFQHWDGLQAGWNPGGVWRPVRIEETGPVRIAQLRVLCREATAERAIVSFRATLDSDEARTVQVQSTVGKLYHGAERSLARGTNTIDWTLTVERPALWWPHALGTPTLHDVRVAVNLAADDGGALSDERKMRTGLRTVRLRNWICSVNGERLFLKGANHGPTRMALAEASPEELRGDIELAVETGLDLVRLHGHITRPELYDAADEMGVLLWQDMPLQWGYARGIRRQAVRQVQAAVDLLAHRPSIAVWCGHNEPLAIEGTEWNRARRGRTAFGLKATAAQQLPTWNKSVLDSSLKRAFQRADGTRPVVAHSGVVPHLPRLDGTDAHLYFGWDWGEERSFPAFCRAVPRMVRFVSEFGAQAVPSGKGAAFMEPDRWPTLDWERLEREHGLQKSRFDRYVPPADHPTYEAWQAATQRYQATVIKHHVEALRKIKYRPTGGFAQFFLADNYPAVSWSVLGYDRVPKLGLTTLREVCRPVIVVADRPPESLPVGAPLALDIHVVSDRREAVERAEVTAKLSWSGGDNAWRWTGDVPADSCVLVGTLQTVVPDAPGPVVLELELRRPEGELVTNRYESTIVD